MTLSTTYRGHDIEYSENTDEWFCQSIGYRHALLSKVKDRVNKVYLNLRKNSAVQVQCVDCNRNSIRVTEGVAMEYMGFRKGYHYQGEGVAVMAGWRGSSNRSRSVIDRQKLCIPGPEFDAQWSVVQAAFKEVEDAQARLAQQVAALPYVTDEYLAGLIAARDIELNPSETGNE